MKKLLLLATCFAFTVSVQAQSNRVIKAPDYRDLLKSKMRINESANLGKAIPGTVKAKHIPNSTSAKTSMVLAKANAGNSINIFGNIVEQSNNLNANQDLGLWLFTHRACSEFVSGGTAASGDVNATVSTNGGVSWDSTLVITSGVSTGSDLRYPTGAIYNPSGNTTVANAYAVGSGPYHIGGVWTGGFYGSRRFDASNQAFQVVPTAPPTEPSQFPRVGSVATSQGHYHVAGIRYDDQNAPTLILGFPISRGVFDGGTNAFVYTQTEFANVYDERYEGNLAFSEDGNTGYFAILGIDTINVANNHLSSMPIIWKTTDAGATWNLEPIYDYSNATNMASYLQPTTSGTYRPFFSAENGMDLTVDKWGNLHIVCQVYSAASDHPDSLNFIYPEQYIMDVYGSGTSWAACKVADLLTGLVPDASSPWTNAGAGVGWNARIQCGRTHDGSKVFYGWVDSDPTIDPLNLFPDIHIGGMNVDTWMAAPQQNVTAGTAYGENNLWMYMSSIVFANGGINSIGMITTDSRDPSAPGEGIVDHYGVSGIELSDASFTDPCPSPVGITENNTISGISVSQNHPNPFNDGTSFTVKLDQTASVSVEITNYIGQVVYRIDEQNYTAGSHEIVIDGKKLNAGVYFYAVKIGNDKITNKMIVQ